MSDNKLPPIDVSENSGRFKSKAQWLEHLEKYKKQNPEKYIAKERVGDFEKQEELLFGKADPDTERSLEKIASQVEKSKAEKIAEAKDLLASLEPEKPVEVKEEKTKKLK